MANVSGGDEAARVGGADRGERERITFSDTLSSGACSLPGRCLHLPARVPGREEVDVEGRITAQEPLSGVESQSCKNHAKEIIHSFLNA